MLDGFAAGRSIKARMKAYERRTMPLIDFCSGLGLQERGENQAIEKNVDFRNARLSGQSSCPRGVNLFGMWRVQRLDQINAFKPANLFDFKSLALKIRKKQIGRFKTGARNRSERSGNPSLLPVVFEAPVEPAAT
jgi:hypothetical protein